MRARGNRAHAGGLGADCADSPVCCPDSAHTSLGCGPGVSWDSCLLLPSSAEPQGTPPPWGSHLVWTGEGGHIIRADFLEEADFGLGLKEGFRDARKEEGEPSRHGVPCQPLLGDGHTAAHVTCVHPSRERVTAFVTLVKGRIPERTKKPCPTASPRPVDSPAPSFPCFPSSKPLHLCMAQTPLGPDPRARPSPHPHLARLCPLGRQASLGRGPALCPQPELRLTNPLGTAQEGQATGLRVS